MIFRLLGFSAGVLAAFASMACTGAEDSADWEIVMRGLEGALTSVWGTREDDVWAVGADPLDGKGPYVLQWNGNAWRRHEIGAAGDLWWVWADAETVWVAGVNGLVARHDRSTDAWTLVPTATDARLFGVVQLAANDVWAVGGDVEQQTATVLRGDGVTFTEVLIPDGLASGLTPFKVWGETADDVWIVGLGGAALHWDGIDWSRHPVPLGRPLFTVHGHGQDIVAVGGAQTGLIVDVTEDGLENVTPTGIVPQLNGVFVPNDGHAVAVGNGGAVWRLMDGAWQADVSAPELPIDFHATYVDPTGGVWGVGGFVLAEPLRDGILVHHGDAIGEVMFQ